MTNWSTPFPVGSVYRFDLQRLGWTNEQIDQLSDMDMLHISQKMHVLHLQGEFWKHLEVAAGEVLQEEEQLNHETVDGGVEKTASPALFPGKRARPDGDL